MNADTGHSSENIAVARKATAMPAISRRSFTTGAVGAVFLLAACSAPGSDTPAKASGYVPDKPGSPVKLNILDVAGHLQLTRGMIDDFAAKDPGVVSGMTYSKSPAPELVGKIKAQQNANRVDIDIVLTGVDGLSAGIEQGLRTPLLPKYSSRLPGMQDYLPAAAAMQRLAGGCGVTVM
jgi:putative spermidine/putrescine transport system substrate-binding protein